MDGNLAGNIPFQVGVTLDFAFWQTDYLNLGGVIYVPNPASFPTSTTGLNTGDLYINSGLVCVVGTTSQDITLLVLVYPDFTLQQLFQLGGLNFPMEPGLPGTLWNNAGVVSIA